MMARISVYYFTKDLRPILSSEESIICEPRELGRAALAGKYAIEDTQKKPAPSRYSTAPIPKGVKE
jgi:hypothetical protein